MRSYGGSVFRLGSHLERLDRSLRALQIDWPVEPVPVRREIDRLLQVNGLAEARIRLTITGGLSDGSLRLTRSNPPTVLLMAGPLRPTPKETYEQGIDLIISSFRQPWASPLARIKTIHRLEYLMAREEALREDAADALILDDRGNVAECSSSNIFLLLDGRLVTPPLDSPILPGVTREVTLEAAAAAGVPAVEGPVAESDLWRAVEIFVTATSYELLTVRAVNGRAVGSGRLGPVTARLHDAFREIVAREAAPRPPL